jgi:ribosomal protein L44E
VSLPPRRHRNSDKAKQSRVCQPHEKWVRGFACSSCGHHGSPDNPIEAAHIRLGTGGGMGIKPSSRWVVSLCRNCHQHDQHQKGERSFWNKLGIADPKRLAEEFARKSPHWPKLREMP